MSRIAMTAHDRKISNHTALAGTGMSSWSHFAKGIKNKTIQIIR